MNLIVSEKMRRDMWRERETNSFVCEALLFPKKNDVKNSIQFSRLRRWPLFFSSQRTISWSSIRDFVKINKLSQIAVKSLQTVQNHDIIYKRKKKRYRRCKRIISGFIPGRRKRYTVERLLAEILQYSSWRFSWICRGNNYERCDLIT